jgi:outer membrane receptor protein involved in Fe transport
LRGGVWAEDTIQLSGDLTLTPGVRFDWSSVNGGATLSPRLGIFWRAGSRTRLKLAAGLYTQSPGYEKLQSADYLVDLSDARAKGIRHERAEHLIVGIERTLGGGFRLSLEGYYKRFRNLIVGRLETEAERMARVSRYDFPDALQSSVPTAPIITSNPSNGGRGDALGLDLFLLKRPTGPTGLYGWLAYTLGDAQHETYGSRFPFDYDRRHALNLVANYRISRKWTLGVTGRWATGFAYTAPIGVRVASTDDPAHDPNNPEPPTLVPATDVGGNLIYAIDLGDTDNLNRGRLPHYARIDTRLTFRPGGATGCWEAYLEVLNVLNRRNAGVLEPSLVFDPLAPTPRIQETAEAALPLLPSFGVRFRF